jgi:hypothetical protein
MLSNDATNKTRNITRRQASIIAGVSLLLMAILAPIANFGAVVHLIVKGDPVATLSNIISSIGMFRVGIFLFLIVAVLDVIVAWALYILFTESNKRLSLLAAWFRLVYTAVLVTSINHLSQVLSLIGKPGREMIGADQIPAQVTFQLNSFQSGWDLGLLIFGGHLIVLGYLVIKSMDFPKFLGILIFIAGLGYVIDSIGKILISGYSLQISMYTFIGEVLLIFWLFWRGFKGFNKATNKCLQKSLKLKK